MKKILFLLLLLLTVVFRAPAANPLEGPKREMRGTWIQCVNGQFLGMSREQMQANLTNQLNVLQAAGINAVMFQVRPEADALYRSSYEPWSRWLTGRQGQDPGWDPLEWMVRECHRRGMELHAWINPFRAKTKDTKELAANHPYWLKPDRFFSYDGLIIFDPGQIENQRYICDVAADIVRRYDVDGLHIDDYFYPYPVPGLPIPDDATFAANRNGFNNRADWRRYNVNTFIKMLYNTVHSIKPWVKFGVSPFGIYHNLSSGGSVPGSDTRGLQNYDDLYADVLFWVGQGWGGLRRAATLLAHRTLQRRLRSPLALVGKTCCRTSPLHRTGRRTHGFEADLNNPTVNQMNAKFELQRSFPSVQGHVIWYSAAVVRNEGNYAYELQNNYHLTPALVPQMPSSTTKPRRSRANSKPCGCPTATISSGLPRKPRLRWTRRNSM